MFCADNTGPLPRVFYFVEPQIFAKTIAVEAIFLDIRGRRDQGSFYKRELAPPAKNAARAATAFFAEGGLVTKPTLAILGEKGPEIVIPLDHPATAMTAKVGGNPSVIDMVPAMKEKVGGATSTYSMKGKTQRPYRGRRSAAY